MSFLFFLPDGPAAYCCTCTGQLSTTLSEKPYHRQLPCCQRLVCGRCIESNPRFAAYCPYCPVATASASRQREAAAAAGLGLPPPYAEAAAPPPYEPATVEKSPGSAPVEKSPGSPPATNASAHPPVVHFLDHDRDSVASLSLRYRVSADAIRRANHLGADHLLLGRRVVHIPTLPTTAASSTTPPPPSLSPHPVEGAAAARRKAAIRRFMVACKVPDYDLAVLYLDQTAVRAGHDHDDPGSYDLAAAVAAYQADEQWERAHPFEATKTTNSKGKGRLGGSGGAFFFSRRQRSRTDDPTTQ